MTHTIPRTPRCRAEWLAGWNQIAILLTMGISDAPSCILANVREAQTYLMDGGFDSLGRAYHHGVLAAYAVACGE